MKMMRKLVVVLLFALQFFINGSVLNAQTPLDKSMDFVVVDVHGATHHLDDYLDDDKIVVIDFFTVSCTGCQYYASRISASYEYFGLNQGNVIFLAVNMGSDNATILQFDEEFGMLFPSVSGTEGGGDEANAAYKIESYPTVIIITPDHKVVEKYIYPPTTETMNTLVAKYGGVPVGLNENIQNSVAVYPNPAEDYLYIKYHGEMPDDLLVKIIGVDGKVLKCMSKQEFEIDGKDIKLNLMGVDSGIYFVSFVSNCEGLLWNSGPVLVK